MAAAISVADRTRAVWELSWRSVAHLTERICGSGTMSDDIVKGNLGAYAKTVPRERRRMLAGGQLATEKIKAALLLMAQSWHRLAHRLEAARADDSWCFDIGPFQGRLVNG
jgi:hypothetical protein